MNSKSTTAPSRPPKEARIDSIVESAREVFCRLGYENASIVEISNKANIAEGTLYRYFDGKRALLYEVLRRHYQVIFDDIRRTLPGVHGHGNRLRYLVRRALLAIAGDRGMCGLITRELRQDADERHSIAHDLNQHYAALIVEVLEAGIEDGTFREDTAVNVIRDMIGGGLELTAWTYMVTGREIDVDDVSESMTATVLGGIERLDKTQAPMTDVVERLERIADRLER